MTCGIAALLAQTNTALQAEPEAVRALLAGKVEDMLNTVVRQIAFHEFERRVHAERRCSTILPLLLAAVATP